MVTLRHPPIGQESATQLGHGIGRPGHGVQEGEEEWPVPYGLHKVRHVHRDGDPHPRVVHGPEMGELLPTGVR